MRILEELCAGLHYAHCAAIVHRDIKPANVMRDESGLVKILDFGIARGGGEGLTRVGDIVGMLNYMSPEQLVGKSVDHRADIYSVGALAYELITNQMAFPGTIETGVLYTILDSGPVPIASLIPGIDPDITAMVERAMAREPHARYRDLETLRQDLAVLRGRGCLKPPRTSRRRLTRTPKHDSPPESALAPLIRGLALDDKDSELNALVDELAEAAWRTATEARAAADVRGANPKSSAAFREG